VTDDGLEQLALCRSLKRIELRNASCTERGVNELLARLPEVEHLLVTNELQQALQQLRSCTYFFGTITRTQAEALLTSKPIGTYLIRFSEKSRKIVISSSMGLPNVVGRSSVHHVLVDVTPRGVCWGHNDGPEVYASVADLIRDHKHTYAICLDRTKTGIAGAAAGVVPR